jgi:hypothetical protein
MKTLIYSIKRWFTLKGFKINEEEYALSENWSVDPTRICMIVLCSKNTDSAKLSISNYGNINF